MEYPEYDGKESMASYLERVDIYHASEKQRIYDKALIFYNDWLKSKYKSLSDIKNIPEKKLIGNHKRNIRVIRRNLKDIKKIGIELSIDSDTEDSKIKNDYIMYISSKILSRLKYKMNKLSRKGEIYYTIKMK